MTALQLRRLSAKERETAFARGSSLAKMQQWLDTVREMEGGVAYAIPVNGTTARAIRVNLGKAAKRLDLQLRWAKVPKDTKEVIVELCA